MGGEKTFKSRAELKLLNSLGGLAIRRLSKNHRQQRQRRESVRYAFQEHRVKGRKASSLWHKKHTWAARGVEGRNSGRYCLKEGRRGKRENMGRLRFCNFG